MTVARAVAALLTVGAALLTGCAAPAADAQPALAFTAATVAGGRFDGTGLSGRPAVLWFWAPWCTVCRAESPAVREVAAEFDGQVDVIGVAGRGPVADMTAFVEDTGTGGLTHLADVDGDVWSRFGILAQPSFAFVSPDGGTEVFAGSLAADDLRAAVLELIGS